MNIVINTQFEDFIKSLSEEDRVKELLSGIQMVCLNDSELFKGHQDIEKLESENVALTNKIESKKIILDKAISAIKEMDERYNNIHTKNARMASECLNAMM